MNKFIRQEKLQQIADSVLPALDVDPLSTLRLRQYISEVAFEDYGLRLTNAQVNTVAALVKQAYANAVVAVKSKIG